MLYWLVTAMYPQFLITLDENDEEQDVTVRVGQAVNTIGLAGTRSGISGVSVFRLFLSAFGRRLREIRFCPLAILPYEMSFFSPRPRFIHPSTSYTSSFTTPFRFSPNPSYSSSCPINPA